VLTPEQEVWELELRYWHLLEASDHAAYMELWHPDFLGWPRDRDLPTGFSGMDAGVRRKMSEGRVSGHEILSHSVTVVGDVGVTQYGVRAMRVTAGGATEQFTSRVTHTWLRTGGTWRIVGGMSAPLESSAHTW
jgi:ketosteroid isomerase-like protein